MISRTLDRYIFGEMLPPFLLSMAVLTLVFLLQKLFQLADLVVSKGATVLSMAKVLALSVPGFFVITIPMSLLVAALTTFARLSADSEITAMRASRISLYRMIRPVFLFAILAFAITAFTSLMLVPKASAALKAHLFNIVKSRAMVGIEPGIFSNTFDGMVIYVDKMNSNNQMTGVFISDERSAKDPYAIVAKRGDLVADPQALIVTLNLKDGTIHTVPHEDQMYTKMAFDTAHMYINISNALSQKGTPGRVYEDMDSVDLALEIGRMRQEGKPTYTFETELNKRLSIPFACLIFGLIGAPLGIRKSRTGKSAGVALALLAFLVYYIILASSTNLAETGTVRPVLAYWIPNAIMATAAVLFVIIRAREVDFMIMNRISKFYYGLKERMRKTTPP